MKNMKKTGVFTGYELSFIISLSIAMALRQLVMVIIMPILSIYGNSLAYSTPVLIGVVFGIYGLVQGIMQIPLGRISDRIGRKAVVTIGSLFLGGGLILAAYATNIYLLIAARILQGFGAITAVCFSWIGDNIDEQKRNRSMSIVGIFTGLAAVLGFLGGPVLYNFISVSKMFLACAVFVFLSWIYILIFIKKDDTRQKQAEKVDYIELAKNRLFVGLSLSAFFQNYLMVSVFYVIPILIQQSIGAGRMWEVFIPATIIGIALMQVTSRLADKGKERIVLIFSFTATAVSGVCLLLSSTNFIFILISTILFMCGYLSLNAVLPGSVTKLSTTATRGGVTGIYNTVQYIGSFIGGILSGVLWGLNAYLPAVSIIVVSLFGAILVSLMVKTVPTAQNPDEKS
jgi:MFS family permease